MTTLETVTEAALADAAKRTGLGAPRSWSECEAVTWADGSLGCPEPGMKYTMALVPGYRIASGRASNCSTTTPAGAETSVLCPAGRADPPSRVGRRRDLSQRKRPGDCSPGRHWTKSSQAGPYGSTRTIVGLGMPVAPP